MPHRIFSYVKGLLVVSEEATCTALARILENRSHDSLSRILNDTRLEWQTLLSSLIARIRGKLDNGWLIIDDTVIDKSFARIIEGIAWVFSSKDNRSVLGLNIVVLCWSNGIFTLPLAIKVWKPQGKKSKYDLALELLGYARNILQIQPQFVLFDSWYASKAILKRCRWYGWIFVSQLKRNRMLNGIQVQQRHRNPYWMEQGTIFNGLDVLVVRHGKRYYVTNDLSCSKQELLRRYKLRWSIENIFRMLHGKLGMNECQSISLQAQTAHIHLSCMAFRMLEYQKRRTKKSWYQLRRDYRFHPSRVDSLYATLYLGGA